MLTLSPVALADAMEKAQANPMSSRKPLDAFSNTRSVRSEIPARLTVPSSMPTPTECTVYRSCSTDWAT
jgi:hypothetical protein